MNDWLKFSKSTGEAESKAIARTGLATLERSYGEKICRDFLQRMLADDVPKDARGWFRDVANPMSRRLESASGEKLESFLREWNATLLLRSTPQVKAE